MFVNKGESVTKRCYRDSHSNNAFTSCSIFIGTRKNVAKVMTESNSTESPTRMAYTCSLSDTAWSDVKSTPYNLFTCVRYSVIDWFPLCTKWSSCLSRATLTSAVTVKRLEALLQIWCVVEEHVNAGNNSPLIVGINQEANNLFCLTNEEYNEFETNLPF